MPQRFYLLLFCLLFSSVAFAQAPADSSRNLTAKQERKYQDSVAKNLKPVDGKAIVYIIRHGVMGAAIPFRLDCDSFLVGWVAAGTYLYTIIDPGSHVFKAQSENDYELPLTVEAGKIYFLDQESRMGVMYARTKLKPLNEQEGRKLLDKCHLSKHNRYPEMVLSRNYDEKPTDGD